MDKFQSHQIVQVILRMRYGIATEEERRLFEAWVKSGEGRQALYDKINSNESLKEHLDLKADYHNKVDYRELQAVISRSLSKRNRQRKVKRYSLWLGSTAAVILAACMVVMKYTDAPTDILRETPRVVKVVPDRKMQDNVILVLSDGKRVGMSTISQDSMRVGTAVVMGQEEKLVYDSDAGRVGSVVVEEKLEINKIITTTGGFYSLVLSDGTRVWLNSESELEYPVLFGKGKRLVKLVGEAFFEVAKDSLRPFIVETCDIRTKVLGTSFNIKAYGNEASVAATLFTGKVEVSPVTDTLGKVVLSPGKQADWNLQTKRFIVAEVNLANTTAWKEGMFMFVQENIEVVTRQIERWYGVKFIYQLNDRKKYTFNGCLSKDESLKTILEEFTYVGGPEFKMEGNVVYVKDK